MRALVIGGAGFLGSHLCRRLLRAGAAVRVLDRSLNRKSFPFHGKVETVEAPFQDHDALLRVLRDRDVVFLLVGNAPLPEDDRDPSAEIRQSLLSTLFLLDHVEESGRARVVFFSSGGTVYGGTDSTPINEDHPANPMCARGIRCLAIEQYLALYHRTRGVDYRVLRISNAYGEPLGGARARGAVTAFIERMIERKPVEIWGDGSSIRDYVHAEDITEAAFLAAKHRGTPRIWNIGSGVGRSLNELVQEIGQILDHTPEVRFIPARSCDLPASILDISRAKRELAWEPEITLSTGLRRMFNAHGADAT